ncbi:hypothetical protein [Henriciella algicola]|uniref:Plasmid mobilization relaxosome protein MobC n=1 Tax=Henriciella algicola TaxID=1608422 RepID=A0A399RM20_9PROT|nr:hypothetical protein [Henriciella algicola]RIJ31037.1 hypothetical protein D1222_01850 [Henriciella algicola]
MIDHDFQRSANPKPKRPAPFSLRLTKAERARLERDAGSLSLNAYIRGRLFGEHASPRRRVKKSPVQDRQELAKVLAALGRSSLAANVNQLAKGMNTGTLPAIPETDEAIRKACYDIAYIRMTLMKALGKQPES